VPLRTQSEGEISLEEAQFAAASMANRAARTVLAEAHPGEMFAVLCKRFRDAYQPMLRTKIAGALVSECATEGIETVPFGITVDPEWRRSSGSAAFRSRGARSLVRRGDRASAGRIRIDADGSSWSLARPPDARWVHMAPVFALPLGFLNKRVAHSLLRAASRACHDHRWKLRRSLERGIRARASSRSAGSKSRVLARSFPA
jgi:hypothetical protein